MNFQKPKNHFCAMFGHNYKFVAQIDSERSELVCKCCGDHFVSNSDGQIINLSIYKEALSTL